MNELDITFGEGYDRISVKRDRHERFLSMWKFFIKRSKIYGNEVHKIVGSLRIEDILSFNHSDLDKSKIYGTIDLFLADHKLTNSVDWYFKNLLFILWQPTSMWHNNDKRIIWFDFNKLNEMEEWVSDKLGRSFRLENFNSSKSESTYITIDENFIEKYNRMYDRFDLMKNKKSII
jgi:hypothetical protein